MGCCQSRTEENSEAQFREGKPFTKEGLSWTADPPITQKQLEIQRAAFWDTAPTYEGRLEIWQALKCAVEADDHQLAQAVLDSANIVVPTGFLNDGCYDELGNRYEVPLYCIIPPSNLLSDIQPAPYIPEKPKTPVVDGSDTHQLTIRLSVGRDVLISVHPGEPLGFVRKRVLDIIGAKEETHRLRFVYLGKVLKDDQRIGENGVPKAGVLQAMIVEQN
ncbi:uncharacterized protein VTP21DRAFT_9033 [Calcarisporiella thermophila]|uniref:uncharacterized protein n=1 Tax=Calcarisporiella thermophila TaxID=911321 RepID=UPI00374320AA